MIAMPLWRKLQMDNGKVYNCRVLDLLNNKTILIEMYDGLNDPLMYIPLEDWLKGADVDGYPEIMHFFRETWLTRLTRRSINFVDSKLFSTLCWLGGALIGVLTTILLLLMIIEKIMLWGYVN